MVNVSLLVWNNDEEDYEVREVYMPCAPRIGEEISCFNFFKDVWIDGFEEDSTLIVSSVLWVHTTIGWRAEVILKIVTKE